MPRRGALMLGLCMAVVGCGGGGGGSPSGSTVVSGPLTISWTANREAAVNAPGGGYRIYYGPQAELSQTQSASVSVPYVDGAATPTQVRLNLEPGVHYIRVVAYSALEPEGSRPSEPLRVEVR